MPHEVYERMDRATLRRIARESKATDRRYLDVARAWHDEPLFEGNRCYTCWCIAAEDPDAPSGPHEFFLPPLLEHLIPDGFFIAGRFVKGATRMDWLRGREHAATMRSDV